MAQLILIKFISIANQWVSTKIDHANWQSLFAYFFSMTRLSAQLVTETSCNNKNFHLKKKKKTTKTMSAFPTNTSVRTLSMLFHQCRWDHQLSTGGPVSDAGICSLMGAWFSESTPALLAHYSFMGLLWSCGVQAWWVECHFTYISRGINLLFSGCNWFWPPPCTHLDPSVGEHVSGSVLEKKKLVSSWGKARGCSHWLKTKTNVLLCNSSCISFTVFCTKWRSNSSTILAKYTGCYVFCFDYL